MSTLHLAAVFGAFDEEKSTANNSESTAEESTAEESTADDSESTADVSYRTVFGVQFAAFMQKRSCFRIEFIKVKQCRNAVLRNLPQRYLSAAA